MEEQDCTYKITKKKVNTRVVALSTLFLRIKELFSVAIMLPLKYNKNKNIVYKN